MKTFTINALILFCCFMSSSAHCQSKTLTIATFNTFSSPHFYYDRDFEDYLRAGFKQAGFEININLYSLRRLKTTTIKYDIIAPVPKVADKPYVAMVPIINTRMCLFSTLNSVPSEKVAARHGLVSLVPGSDKDNYLHVSGNNVIERLFKLYQTDRVSGFIASDVLLPEINQQLPEVQCKQVLANIVGYLRFARHIPKEYRDKIAQAFKQQGLFREHILQGATQSDNE